MSEGKSSNFWPFLIGFLAGAVAGILLAPEKGEVSRRRLKKKAVELKDKYEAAVSEVREKAEPIVKKTRQAMAPVFKEIEEVGELAKEELEEAAGESEPLASFDSRSSNFSPQTPTEPVKEPPHRRLFFRNIR